MRRMLRIILFIAVGLITIYGEAIAGAIYVISGIPKAAVSMPEFPAILYMVDENAKSIINVRKLADDKVYNIHLYYDERLGFALRRERLRYELHRPDMPNNAISKYLMIDMDAPNAEKAITVDPAYVSQVNDGMLLLIPDKGAYVASHGNKYIGDNPSLHDWGKLTKLEDMNYIIAAKNINTGIEEEFSKAVQEQAILYGRSSSLIAGGGECILADQDEDNYITVIADQGVRVRTQLKLPKKIKHGDKEYTSICVNNKEMLVVTATKLIERENGLGSSKYYILDKETGEWDLLTLRGGQTNVQTFGGPWLTGVISGNYTGTPSPGHEKRKFEPSGQEAYYNWAMKDRKKYDIGEIYLYNIKTKKKLSIKTDEGDTEVLLVDGDTVYYRVNDEIYKATIEKNKVGDGVLIAKDDAILNVHWAFMGP